MVDDHAQLMLETSTEVKTSDLEAVEVKGDGDCIFHSFQAF
jgi:hypothetical protein